MGLTAIPVQVDLPGTGTATGTSTGTGTTTGFCWVEVGREKLVPEVLLMSCMIDQQSSVYVESKREKQSPIC